MGEIPGTGVVTNGGAYNLPVFVNGVRGAVDERSIRKCAQAGRVRAGCLPEGGVGRVWRNFSDHLPGGVGTVTGGVVAGAGVVAKLGWSADGCAVGLPGDAIESAAAGD